MSVYQPAATHCTHPAPALLVSNAHNPPTNQPAGTCAFSEKAQAAQDAGAAGVLIYDNVLQAYFTWGGTDAVGAFYSATAGQSQ